MQSGGGRGSDASYTSSCRVNVCAGIYPPRAALKYSKQIQSTLRQFFKNCVCYGRHFFSCTLGLRRIHMSKESGSGTAQQLLPRSILGPSAYPYLRKNEYPRQSKWHPAQVGTTNNASLKTYHRLPPPPPFLPRVPNLPQKSRKKDALKAFALEGYKKQAAVSVLKSPFGPLEDFKALIGRGALHVKEFVLVQMQTGTPM